MNDACVRKARLLAAAVVLLSGCERTFLVGSYNSQSAGLPTPDSGGLPTPDSGDATTPGWRLVWQDDFDGPAGSAPNPANWTYDVGGTGWGNQELQFYTARQQNAFLDGDSTLYIHAAAESYMGLAYTSARLKTQGLFEQAYGRFEVMARVPAGQGLWSSFWMLGNDRDVVGWPDCGDINVMSVFGSDATVNRAGAHGPGYNEEVRGFASLPGSPNLSDAFHLFAVEWDPDQLRYYIDDVLYATKGPADLPSGATWVQNHPYFLLLNVAVGGHAGTPSASAFPADLKVKYVRVYTR
jgi:beta-glucanase (GH16 family)